MLVSQRIALSLLITVLLFIIFTALAFTGLFDLIETRFYNPSIIKNIVFENNRSAGVLDRFFSEMQERFSNTLTTQAVRRGFLSDQNPEDVSARSNIYSVLAETINGLQWVRFIDSEGRRLHFSSFAQDILHPVDQAPVYLNYSEADFPYEMVAVENHGEPKCTFDGKSGRVLFSFPLYDSFDIYRGTAVFSLSMDAMLDRLINEGRVKFGQNIMVIQNPAGFVFGMSASGEGVLSSRISSIWRRERQEITRLVSPDEEHSLVLISTLTSQGFFVGRLVDEELFTFPFIMKIILLLSFFFTVYLIIFLLFSLRQDPVAIIQNRQKQLINKFREELLFTMKSPGEAGIDEEKLGSVLKSILASLSGTSSSRPYSEQNLGVAASKATGRSGLLMKASAIVRETENTEQVEELEELEVLEELETLEAVDDDDAVEDIASLASQIEFSPDIKPEISEDQPVADDLEIVSPFSAMLNDLSEFDMDNDVVETIPNRGLPVIVKPFSGMTGRMEIETLETLPEDESIADNGNVIEELEGVPFISKANLSSDPEKTKVIDRDFKELVDSVIK